ncbi:YggS family pyridoxal phosphate-dependent enzyme [soil metagenome]
MSYENLPERLREVRDRIDMALDRGGRVGAEVRIVAVTKTHPLAAVQAAREAGLSDMGENRVQEMEEKALASEGESLRWHLIGPLQRNKVKRALPLISLLHSLDSMRLAQKISSEATEAGLTTRALVQVNASGEDSKGGFAPEELADSIGRMMELPSLELLGLMTMAPYTTDERVLRDTFSRVRVLGEELQQQVHGFRAQHLSMGMSNDYEIAVEEGSTLVRLGTVLLGERVQ